MCEDEVERTTVMTNPRLKCEPTVRGTWSQSEPRERGQGLGHVFLGGNLWKLSPLSPLLIIFIKHSEGGWVVVVDCFSQISRNSFKVSEVAFSGSTGQVQKPRPVSSIWWTLECDLLLPHLLTGQAPHKTGTKDESQFENRVQPSWRGTFW